MWLYHYQNSKKRKPGHVIFWAESQDSVKSTYGDYGFAIDESHCDVNVRKILDKTLDAMAESDEFEGYDLDDDYLLVPRIVNTVGFWENGNFLYWFQEYYSYKYQFVRTEDGAVLMSWDDLKRKPYLMDWPGKDSLITELQYSDDPDKEEIGDWLEFGADPQELNAFYVRYWRELKSEYRL